MSSFIRCEIYTEVLVSALCRLTTRCGSVCAAETAADDVSSQVCAYCNRPYAVAYIIEGRYHSSNISFPIVILQHGKPSSHFLCPLPFGPSIGRGISNSCTRCIELAGLCPLDGRQAAVCCTSGLQFQRKCEAVLCRCGGSRMELWSNRMGQLAWGTDHAAFPPTLSY